MNTCQRRQLYEKPYRRCKYCMTSSGLPLDVLHAAQKGDVDKIQEYIGKCQDVNAHHDGESLLSSACTKGQVEVVKRLLQCPVIHLNTLHQGNTPLMLAGLNGHKECIKLLLNSSVECSLKFDHCWGTITNVLREKPQLSHRAALHIINWAGRDDQWEVVELILQTEHQFTREVFYTIIMRAVYHSQWDIVSNILKRDFYGRDDLTTESFGVSVILRQWAKAEELLQMMDPDLKFELPFVQAAIAGKVDEVQRMWVDQQYDVQTFNGNLLVVAAGGTTEPIAQLLMTVKNTYTKRTLSEALFLSSNWHYTELAPSLMSSFEASYSFRDLSRCYIVLKFYSRSQTQGDFLMDYFNKVFSNKLENWIPKC